MSGRLRSSTRASTAASTAASESLAETHAETKSRSESRKSSSATSRPMKASEMTRIIRVAMLAFVVSGILMGATLFMVLNDHWKLYPQSLSADSLSVFSARVEYALRYQMLLFAWLVFNFNAVIMQRMSMKALNPLDNTEKHVQMHKNILTNSFEQIFLSCMLQLVFVSFSGKALTLRLIPAINVTQFLGRICFYLGYPYYRTFGFSLTSMPNLALTIYNLYKLGAFFNLYP